ncbi:N-6 DNA Methylase [Geosporobacter subterraneus DSM 17957]|uniref:site-specific DNA-methyltransferase (adenine-specific) n=1 Tax=Geosporobacter subterraneus DSM 17957 TaxID=1121919 RepID=A0A1M6LSH6_9FIRM|nr:TaqI-like C-terminal specificity domain-containing protein [Geosporobacter subterraneus]SHJ74167.1 N-6 DNA Methylase [Geosporobacter subterraneus DSM 17957]
MKNIRRDITNIKKKLKKKYSSVEDEVLFRSFFALVLEEYSFPESKVFQNILFDKEESDYLKYCISKIQIHDINLENMLGWIYQFFYEDTVVQEKLAQYYTERWIVEYIVDHSLDLFLSQNPERPLKTIKILDPCCGTGHFTFYIIDKMVDWYRKREGLEARDSLPIILQRNLFVIDTDQIALEIFKISLTQRLRILGLEACETGLQILNGDYLTAGFDQFFDLILGNPPYLENRKINKYLNKAMLKENFKAARGRFDLVSVFIEKSIGILKDKGVLGYIVPANILLNNNFAEIRQIMLNSCAISQVINLGEGVFSHVSMDMCMLILQKVSDDCRKKNWIFTKNLRQAENKKRELKDSSFKQIKQAYYYNTLKSVFDIHSSDQIFQLRSRIYEKYPLLKESCEIIAGIAPGNIRHKLLSDKKLDVRYVPVLEGKDIRRYGYQWQGTYLLNDRNVIDKHRGEYATFMREEFVLQPKLVIRQTADRFIAAYEDQNYYLLNTLYACLSRNENLKLKYILALLNSKLLNFLYYSLIHEAKKLFPQIKIYHIQNSPIKIENLGIQQHFIDFVNRIEYLNKEYNGQKSRQVSLEKEIAAQQKKLDRQVYQLFELTHREIEEIESIYTEI